MIPLKVGLHNKDYRSKLASFEEQKKYILHFKKALAQSDNRHGVNTTLRPQFENGKSKLECSAIKQSYFFE